MLFYCRNFGIGRVISTGKFDLIRVSQYLMNGLKGGCKGLEYSKTPKKPLSSSTAHRAMFKCGGLRYTSTLSKISWSLCWYSCNLRESENNVRPPEPASWPPRMKKHKVFDILAVSECRIILATRRSWSFFEPMLMIYVAQWDHL